MSRTRQTIRLAITGVAALLLVLGLGSGAQAAEPALNDAVRELRRGYESWLDGEDRATVQAAFSFALDHPETRAEAHFALGVLLRFEAAPLTAARHLLAVCALEPASARCALAADLFGELEAQSDAFPELVAPLRAALEAPTLTAEARAELARVLARLLTERGEIRAARALLIQRGEQRAFAVSPPLSVFPLADFERRYGPETDASAIPDTGELETRGWRIGPRPGGLGLHYLALCATAEEPATWHLALDSANPLAIFWNGAELLRRDSRARYLSPRVRADWASGKGPHQLLVKLAAARDEEDFVLRLSASAASWRVVPGRCATAAAEPGFAPRLAPLWPASRAGTIAGLEDWFLALSATRAQDIDNARLALDALKRQRPRFASAEVLAAELALKDPALPEGAREREAAGAYRRALALDDAQPLALYAMTLEFLLRDQLMPALRNFARLEARAPEDARLGAARFSVYVAQGWQAEAAQAARALLDAHARNMALVREIKLYAESQGDFALAKEAAARLHALNPQGLERAAWHAEGGDLEAAIAAAEHAAEENADGAFAADFLRARLLLRQGARQAAKDALIPYTTNPGENESATRSLADALFLGGESDKAHAALKALVAANPTDLDAQRLLALLDGRWPFDDELSLYQALRAEYAKEAWEADAGALVLLDETFLRFFADGASLMRTHTLTRVHTKDAIARYGEVAIPKDAALISLLVHKPDGATLLAVPIEGKSTRSLPALEPGDVIETDYLTARPASRAGYFAPFVFGSREAPIYRSRVVVHKPEGFPLSLTGRNGAPEPLRTREADGGVRAEALATRLPTLAPDPMMPELAELAPSLRIETAVLWVSWRDRLRDSLAGKRRKNLALDAFLAGVLPARAAVGQAEVRALFYAVLAEIKGEGRSNDFTQDAAQILAAKEGNRLLVLGALLDALGVPNELVLAAPLLSQADPPELARPNLYDDPLLIVWPDDEKELILDADGPFSQFDRFSPLLFGAHALQIERSRGSLFRQLPWRMPLQDAKLLLLDLTLKPDGSGTGSAVEEVGGYYAQSLRRALGAMDERRLSRFIEGMLNQNFHLATLRSIKVENRENPEKPLRLFYTFDVRALAKTGPQRLTLAATPFPLNLTTSYMPSVDRTYPFLIGKQNLGHSVLRLHLPKGYRLNHAPRTRELDSPYGRYRLRESMSDAQTFEQVRELAIPLARIAPERYGDFCRFVSEVDRAESESFEFVGQ